MADDQFFVSAALKIIGKASTESLLSCGPELCQANYAIAQALLLPGGGSVQAGNRDNRIVEDDARSTAGGAVAVMFPDTSSRIESNDAGNGTQNRLQKYKTWLSKPEHAIVDFAQDWLKLRMMGLDNVCERHDLRRIVMANGPALIALLRRAVKRKRCARVSPCTES